jgi:hypothetical protein
MLKCRTCNNCISLQDTKIVSCGGKRITIISCKLHRTFDISESDTIPCIDEIITKQLEKYTI